MICPITLLARGLAASTPGMSLAPRWLLLVSVQYTVRASWSIASHSGRSILVPPSRSLAWRVLITTAPGSAKPLAAVSGPWPCSSGSQRPRAVGIEACHVQRAVVQQRGVGLGAAGGDAVAADELVDVLEARVLAGIHHRAAVLGDGDPCAFVRGAAQRGALDRRARRVEGVDLDHPAETVELVGVLLRIEAFVVLGPAEEAGLAQAPARLVGIGQLGAVEVEGEVLLARQVGAPGRQAAGAVVQRAQHARPSGSAAVFISAWPAAGPPTAKGVAAVKRRA